ncbi:hypothetical protein UFOVP540_9 [uncultured Caudovirales phage]|uniref:Uncharacterized protein n=1 Tax=uncultured Caudovirales phage TaxID=2100421 RepID=A0A6J5MWQ2_9CAUD|nr:hypothetical protein UFOVP540_9 [uncultured Caudovirales phage]
MSNILIEILAEFTGKKAFKQADTAAATLAKSAKKLGAALGIAFSARAVIQYTKAASIAAAQDQKAQQLLAINLKNLGLAYANLDSEKFIASLESQSAILDDELRPAYAQLARVTGSIATTQKLMTVAFDASSGSGLSYASTIDILSQAFIGNQKGLKQLNLGYTAAELKAKSFDELIEIITNRFAGAGKTALSGYAGQMDKFNLATSNAAETLGGAFLDGFKSIAGNGDIDRATSKIDKFSEGLAGVIRVLTGVNSLEAMLKDVEWTGFLGLVPVAPKIAGAQSPGERKAIDAAAKKAEEQRLKLMREQAKAQAKILADKKLAAAIDKANLALAKGTDVFDMDKIQLNAAMLNQAEQLSKVNNQAQLLGITNDIARLRIKQDILNLEDAIASKDTARITAATKQLDEDLKILGTLQNQNIKLTDIKSILDKIVPKDLINLGNLDAAIAKLNAMSSITGQPKISDTGTATSAVSPSGISGGEFVSKIPTSGVSMGAILEFSDAATERANAMAALMEAQNAADAASFANSSLYKFDVTINTGVGDPNAIAETLDQYLQGAVDRGTLRLR